MNLKKLIVFDFETDGVDETMCSPIQLAAIAIEPRNLEILEDTKFSINIRPPNIDNPDYFTPKVTETIEWHAKNKKITKEAMIDILKKGVEQRVAFDSFKTYIERFNTKKTAFFAPIPCGANIRNFDLPILARMEKEFNDGKPLFTKRDRVDLLDFSFYWFENLAEPKSYAVDALRDFFGLSKDGAHDAIKDVYDCALMIQKFLGLHRKIAPKVTFKNCFAKKKDITNVNITREDTEDRTESIGTVANREASQEV